MLTSTASRRALRTTVMRIPALLIIAAAIISAFEAYHHHSTRPVPVAPPRRAAHGEVLLRKAVERKHRNKLLARPSPSEPATILPPASLWGSEVPSAPLPAPSSRKRPNILFIIADDHSSEAVGYRKSSRFGALAETTHINRLAAEGAVIENSFVVLSLCSPSRATILTGVYPHIHGVTGLNGHISPTVPSYVSILRGAGYRTVSRSSVSPYPSQIYIYTHLR